MNASRLSVSDMVAALSSKRHALPSAPGPRAYSRAALFPAALLLIAAHKPPLPSGELVFDAANPIVDAVIAGVKLRLRVDLEQRNSIELNPATAARLTVKWEDGLPLDVGRIRLESRIAPVMLRILGRDVPSQVADHGRDCCTDADGAVGPDLLPFAAIRWRRSDALPSTGEIVLPLTADATTGLYAVAAPTDLKLRFGLMTDKSVGTAAAGAMLAHAWGGRWDGPPGRMNLIFGVSRPVRLLAFARAGMLAGFRFERLSVRISDFGGNTRLPPDPVRSDELLVVRALERQESRPFITIGKDRLSRCAEIIYTAVPRTLTLRCAFDGTP